MTEHRAMFHRIRARQERHLLPEAEASGIAFAIKPYVDMGNNVRAISTDPTKHEIFREKYGAMVRTLDKLALVEARAAGLTKVSPRDREVDAWDIPEEHAHIVAAAKAVAEIVHRRDDEKERVPKEMVLLEETGDIGDPDIATKVDDIHLMLGIGIDDPVRSEDNGVINYSRKTKLGVTVRHAFTVMPHQGIALYADLASEDT